MGYMTDERRMIQEQARAFAMKEVLPLANKLDPVKARSRWRCRDQMAELGYFGITIPEEYGGLGLGCFEYCLVARSCARAWMSVASLLARGNSIPRTRDRRRSAQRLPARMAKGEILRRSRYRSPMPAPTPRTSRCRAVAATATSGS